MRLYIDLDSLELISGQDDRQRVSTLNFKRGDRTPLEVGFVRSGVLTALPEGAVLTFALKVKGKYDSLPLVFESDFTLAGGEDAPIIYLGSPSFNTVALNTALAVDGDPANDKDYVDLMGEFSWAIPEAEPVSIRTFAARVNNDVIRGDEFAPSVLPGPDGEWVAHGHPQSLTSPQKAQAQENIGLGTAAVLDAGTGAGDVVVLDEDAKIPAGMIPLSELVASLPVANAAARLALDPDDAVGKLVVQADDGTSWMLITGGDAATPGDWVQTGDRAIVISDVAGLVAALADRVPLRSIQTESANFSLGSGEDLLIHRVASATPVVANCNGLVIGTTAAIEWYGVGKVTLSFAGQIINANDRTLVLKERGSRVFVYRASADELQIQNPDNLKSNIPESSDIVFELLGNTGLSSIYNDSRGTGQTLGTSQALTTDAIDMTNGCAVAMKFNLSAFPGPGIENVILSGNNFSRFISSYNGAGAPAPVTWVFRQYFGTGGQADWGVAPGVIGHNLAVGEWLRVVVSIAADGTSTVYLNGLQLYGGTINTGTTSPGKLYLGAGVVPGAVRIWDRQLTGPEITAAIAWLNAN